MADCLPWNIVERPALPGKRGVMCDALCHPGSKGKHCAFGLKTEQYLAHRSKMRLAALKLLDHRVNIAEAALKRVALEDRRRSRRVIGRIDNVLCLMDGPGRGQPDRRVVI